VTPAPEPPAGDKTLRPNFGLVSEPSNPWSMPEPSQTDWSLRPQHADPESPAGDKSLQPNSGWTSEPSNSVACQGENPRPESPGSRPESPPKKLQPQLFVETLSVISTFAKHPTRQLSPKPTTGLQTPIFSSFLGCTSARY
jgi:hypothetical protein